LKGAQLKSNDQAVSGTSPTVAQPKTTPEADAPASGRDAQESPLEDLLKELLDRVGTAANRAQIQELLQTVVRLAQSHADRLDLKIANAALKEMQEGFEVFAPYRHLRKVTMFGSARARPDDPLYVQARDLARLLAGFGWSTVTGAGPGIMAAGLEGAGPEHSFGINIRLPFEQEPNQFIAHDPKLVSMKYFFTRKLLLVKESHGYAVLPGGFGTLDEAFELLTLLQTGKATPAPVVLLDEPTGHYWQAWSRFVSSEVTSKGFINPEDTALFTVTDDVTAAASEIIGFYRNYHSLRWVGPRLVLRLQSRPSEAEVAALSQEFSDIILRGTIEILDGPLPAETREADQPGLARVALAFDRHSYARLRELIDAINTLDSAPALPPGLPLPARHAARLAGSS
jgi:uncharacterized protein (TIGR00730 family)